MSREQSDAEVLAQVARRLFAEGRAMFYEAHERGVSEGLNAASVAEHLRAFDGAVEQERRAFEKQREAIRLQKEAFDLRAKRWAELKATLTD